MRLPTREKGVPHNSGCNHGFDQEQRELLRKRFRLLVLLGAVFVPFFSLVDFIYYPEYWDQFLGCRLQIAGVCASLYLADRSRLGGQWIIGAGLTVFYMVGICITWMIISVNSHGTPYYAGLTLLFVGFCVIIPYETIRLAFHVGALYLIYLAALALFGDSGNIRLFIVQNVFMLATVAILLVASFHDFRRRRKEYCLRSELDAARRQLREYASVLEERVAESEANYATVVNNADVAIFVQDDGIISFPNPRTAEILGCDCNIRNRGGFVDFVQEEERPRVIEAYRKASEEKGVVNIDSVPLKRPDGSELLVAVTVVMIDWHGKKALLHFVRDISERRRLEAELLQARKMEAIGTLAGGIAHDINNILHIITGYVHLIKTRQGDGTGYLAKISDAADRASAIVRQLLLYSRKAESRKEVIDVNEHIVTVCGLIERTIPRMVTIELRLQDGLGRILADPVQFEQIVMNLAVNARDAMPNGGTLFIETCGVVVSGEKARYPDLESGRYIRIRVTDTGCGMDEVTRSRIFDPFFTTKEAGKGTGLGLANVYGIVKKHGGYIYCASSLGKGTSFSIFLPVADEDARSGGEPGSVTVAQESRDIPGAVSGTVLLVDDEPSILEVEKEILEANDYSVHTASSGEEALEVFESRKGGVDVVILDLNMPGMGGYRCLEELKKRDPEVRVIIATGYSGHSKEKNLLAAGASEVIHKPFQINEILSIIRRLQGQGR